MKGTYVEMNRVRNLINEWQSNAFVHPLTCGNNSQSHDVLYPRLDLLSETKDYFELSLVCPDCYWKQDIPPFFIENQDKD